MRKVKFTKAFAGKKKGAVMVCDSQLASHLVRVDKVAQYADKLGEVDKELAEERKAQIEAKVLSQLESELEAKYTEEYEAKVRAEIEADENHSLISKVKAKIVEKLTSKPE